MNWSTFKSTRQLYIIYDPNRIYLLSNYYMRIITLIAAFYFFFLAKNTEI